MNEKALPHMVKIAGIVGHPLRLRLLATLSKERKNVTCLVEALGAGQAQVSKHLAILSSAGLLRCTPQGRCRVYSVANAPEVDALISSLELVARSTDRRSKRAVAKVVS